MAGELTATWKIADQITQRFLRGIPAKALDAQYAPRTRTVAAQFAHIHYLRVKNLETRGGPEFVGSLECFPRGAQPKKTELEKALKASGLAMGRLVEKFETEGKVKSFSRSTPTAYLAYHVAHEAHHRALAIVALRVAGHKLPAEVKYDLWYAWRKLGTS